MMKLRKARSELVQLGFTTRPGHKIWTNLADPGQPRRRVVLSASESSEVRPEQAEKIRRFCRGMMIYCNKREE